MGTDEEPEEKFATVPVPENTDPFVVPIKKLTAQNACFIMSNANDQMEPKFTAIRHARIAQMFVINRAIEWVERLAGSVAQMVKIMQMNAFLKLLLAKLV